MNNRKDQTKDATPAFTLTVDEFRDIVGAAVRAALAESGARSLHTQHSVGSPHQGIVNKPYLSVREAAALAGVGSSTIRLYIRKGQLRPKKFGYRILIAPSELERFISQPPGSKVVELFPIDN